MALAKVAMVGSVIALTSLAADMMVKVMFVPVSPSGTGNTLRSLIHSFLESKLAAPAKNIFANNSALIDAFSTLVSS